MSIPPKIIKIANLSLTLLLITNLYLKITPLGIILSLFWLLINSRLIGEKFFTFHSSLFKTWAGLGLIISFIASFGGIIYFFYQLNNPVIISLIAIITLTGLNLSREVRFSGRSGINFSWPEKSLIIAYSLTITNCFYILFNSKTLIAIRTPWQVIPPKFFVFYFIAVVILIIIILTAKKYIKTTLVLISLQLAITVLLTTIIYPIGFGYDQFIHQATEKVIFEEGLITPKPFYYLGEYSLVVFAAKIFSLSIEIIDKLLLAILTILYLPAIIFYSLNKAIDFSARKSLLLTFLLSIIPLPFIINTTPNGLSCLYFLIIIFLALFIDYNNQKKIHPLLWFLTLAATVIHPIIGLPLTIFTLYLTGEQKINSSRLRRIIFILLFILMSTIIPLAFYFNSKIGGAPIDFHYQGTNLVKQLDFHSPTLPTKFSLIADFIYTWQYNLKWIIVVVSIIGLTYSIKERKNYSLLLLFFALIINSLIIAAFINFKTIIGYEQIDYASRIFDLSFYALAPLFLIGIGRLISRINNQQPKYFIIFFIFLTSLMITSSFYLTFPRNDKYVIGRGFNVSSTDETTVQLIAKIAVDDNYVVLANQSVSAAALKNFGFKKYFRTDAGELFYYPIPTSSPLYQIYLDMIYNSFAQKNAQKAKELTGATTVYVVVNDYWTNFNKLVAAGKKTAVNFWEVDGGKNWVFEF